MERAFEAKKNSIFLASKVLSFRHTKQTSKNVADTTFKVNDNSTNLSMFNLILSLNIEQ